MSDLSKLRNLMRGVSNTQVGLARLAHMNCRSWVNPRSVAALSFETGATQCLRLPKAHVHMAKQPPHPLAFCGFWS
jgi:hypothetical protein